MIVPMGLALLAVRLATRRPLVLSFGRAREIRGRFWQLAIFVSVVPILVFGVALSIWASYGFRYAMLNPACGEPEKPIPWSDVWTTSWDVNAAIRVGRENHLLPEAYLFGLSHVLHHSEARNAYLNGEFRRYGWRTFFPYCFLVKTPLEFFALLALAAAAVWVYRRRPDGSSPAADRSYQPGGSLYEMTPLATLFTVYWLFALTSHLNIGHRHLLPTYPPLLILAGAAAWWFRPPQRKAPNAVRHGVEEAGRNARGLGAVMRVAVIASVLLSAVEAFWSWPHYLAYFNLVAGGPRHGYRHLVDSSLDWSQDLKETKAWLDAHPEDVRDERRLYFSFYGSPPPEYYGIRAQRLPSFPIRWQPHEPQPLTGGTYLISATMLDGVMLTDAGRWNREYESRLKNLRRNVQVYNALSKTPEGRRQLFSSEPEQEWQGMFQTYETMRFSRLASFLRQREADDEIGYSILVYRLTDADVAEAIDGPPVELLDRPEWQIEDKRLGRIVPPAPQ